MARPKRFELLTPWFVAKYSIQLSYGRVFMKSRIISGICVFWNRWPQLFFAIPVYLAIRVGVA